MRLLPLMFLLASTGASLAAHAADWSIQPGSTLGFSSRFQGEAFAGRFARFTPQIRFDPAHLSDGRFDVAIDLASANTSNEERDDMLRGADFFNVGKHAQARFVAVKFRALGGNRYAADGALSLNGMSRPVTLAFTWTPGARPVLAGDAHLKRLDFGIGRGEWTDTEVLPNEVAVNTRLVLAPRK
jgi:polyisoprenoid-binding protein YceI